MGCPAVDKGANQPNVFIDPKSSESFAPYFSNGQRDDLIQRRFLEALIDYWSVDAGQNPISSVYSGPMLDMDYSHVWTWDARPYPEFPARNDIWSDGPNWRRGHWLTGRAGQSDLGQIVADIARRAGMDEIDTRGLSGVLAGFVIDRPTPARTVLNDLGRVFQFDLVDGVNGLKAVEQNAVLAGASVDMMDLAVEANAEPLKLARRPADEQISQVQLNVIGDEGDYRAIEIGTLGPTGNRNAIARYRLPALADRTLAAGWAQNILSAERARDESAQFDLPPSLSALEVGDLVNLNTGDQNHTWRILALEGGSRRRAQLVKANQAARLQAGPDSPVAEAEFTFQPSPIIQMLDLPVGLNATQPRNGLLICGWSDPWPNSVRIYDDPNIGSLDPRAVLTRPASLGVLTQDLAAGREGRWDCGAELCVQLFAGTLDNLTSIQTLSAQPVLAIETPSGYEVLAYQSAQLQPDGTFKLSKLLRGLGGSSLDGASAGANLVVLDDALVQLPIAASERGSDLELLAVPEGQSLNSLSVTKATGRYSGVEHRPLSPVHIRAKRTGLGLTLTWIRRERIDGDGWDGEDIPHGPTDERYRVRIYDETKALVWGQDVTATEYVFSQSEFEHVFANALLVMRLSVVRVNPRWGESVERRFTFAELLES